MTQHWKICERSEGISMLPCRCRIEPDRLAGLQGVWFCQC